MRRRREKIQLHRYRRCRTVPSQVLVLPSPLSRLPQQIVLPSAET